jgi:hypothetical protein
MRKKDRYNMENSTSLPRPSSSDLRGRQSVRATFKLTERAINTISIVATHLGIKQKSLFDHLIDDPQSLNVIAREIKPDRFDKLNRVQKTYVISRKTLTCLGEASKKYAAPRDALVEYSIQRLLTIVSEERGRHRSRKEILGEMIQYLKQGEKILQKSRSLLGEDDPVTDKFETVMTTFRNAHRHIESIVAKGEIIEEI